MALGIISISPNTGLTQGREYVSIQGADFNIAVDADGISRMEVHFGTLQATRVRVRSTTLMDCLTPIHDLGPVDVKVKDLDAVTEATLTNGYTFNRPVIGGGTDSDLWRVMDVLVAEMKRQILDEVIIGSDVDFDGATIDNLRMVELAKVPALVIDGPTIRGSSGSLYRVDEPWENPSTDVYEKIRPQDLCDLQFILSGIDDHKIRLLNLMRDVISFFKRNNVLRILRVDGDPSKGYEEIDMRPPRPQDWRVVSSGNKSSLKYFSGLFTLFGVTIGYGDLHDESRGMTEFDVTVLPL